MPNTTDGQDEETTGMEGDTDWLVLKYLHHAVYLRDQDAMLCNDHLMW